MSSRIFLSPRHWRALTAPMLRPSAAATSSLRIPIRYFISITCRCSFGRRAIVAPSTIRSSSFGIAALSGSVSRGSTRFLDFDLVGDYVAGDPVQPSREGSALVLEAGECLPRAHEGLGHCILTASVEIDPRKAVDGCVMAPIQVGVGVSISRLRSHDESPNGLEVAAIRRLCDGGVAGVMPSLSAVENGHGSFSSSGTIWYSLT